MSARPLRVMIFDPSCRTHDLPRGLKLPVGLSHAWSLGGPLYRALGRVDAWHGARSWAEALAWLEDTAPERPIAEIQVWAHGHPGGARLAGDVLDARALAAGHALAPALDRLRARLLPYGGAFLWFRTCETFAGDVGRSFARAVTLRLGCRVGGHTQVIGVRQPGLHTLAPGELPSWTDDPRAGATLTFLHGRPPLG